MITQGLAAIALGNAGGLATKKVVDNYSKEGKKKKAAKKKATAKKKANATKGRKKGISATVKGNRANAKVQKSKKAKKAGMKYHPPKKRKR